MKNFPIINLSTNLYRIDGPAIEYTNGDKYWYQDGKLHRIDGPAVECLDGYKAWYQNGLRKDKEEPSYTSIFIEV